MRIVFLGPQGTYSHQAAAQAFGDLADAVHATSLDDVVRLVASGAADAGVLPVENSTNGEVRPAVAALLRHAAPSNLRITGEVRVRVRHQLYTQAADLAQIRTVYSHPQVWGQARRWLQANVPHARLVDCESTARAVELAAGDAAAAALAGPSAVTPRVADCSDDPQNTTRFLVLRAHSEQPEGDAEGSAGSAGASNSTDSTDSQTATSYFICRNTTFGEVARAGAALRFVSGVPASAAWRYDLFVEAAGRPDPSWQLLGRARETSKM